MVLTATVVLPAILAFISVIVARPDILSIYPLYLIYYPGQAIRVIRRLKHFGDKANETNTLVIDKDNNDFNGLSKILRISRLCSGDFDMIHYKVYSKGGKPPKFSGRLMIVKGDKRWTIKSDENHIIVTRDLMDSVETIVRRQLAYIMLIVITLWLGLNTYIYLTAD